MIYINPEGEFPRYYGDIMQRHSEWQLGDPLPEGWQEVADTDPPQPGENEIVEDGEPQLVDGVLTRTFIVRPFTDQELEARERIANLRDRLEQAGFTQSDIDAIRFTNF